MARCEEAKKVKVRSVLGIHKQFDFLSLTTQIAVFQQPDRQAALAGAVTVC